MAHSLGGIYKLRHTLRGRGSTKCDIVIQGGGILNFVTSHSKNSIKAILHYVVWMMTMMLYGWFDENDIDTMN